MRSLLLLATLAFTLTLEAQVVVLNGASYRTEQPVTGGSWATAFGTFTGVSTMTASTAPIPKTLGGVTVTVGGTDAPVYYVSATQINFLIPYQAAPGVNTVSIKTASGTVAGTVLVMSTAPGIFTKDTPARGAAINQDGTENTSSNPVPRGNVISLYATGPGAALSTAVADGAVAPSSPLVTTTSTPQVFIGGVPATVQFSGLAPNYVGLWQINVVVPAQTFITGKTTAQIFMDGVDSNEVAIFVAQ